MCRLAFLSGIPLNCSNRNALLGRSWSSWSYPVFLSPRHRPRLPFSRCRTIHAALTDKVGHFDVRVLVPIAEGSEELEAVTVIDTLRRAGANVTVASCANYITVPMSRGVMITADKMMKDVIDAKEEFHAIAIPGGDVGTETMAYYMDLIYLIRDTIQKGGIIAALCSAPANILCRHGFLDGKKATCYPHPKLEYDMGETFVDEKVVVDGNFITGQGPGTALEWALALVEKLYGKTYATGVGEALLVWEPATV